MIATGLNPHMCVSGVAELLRDAYPEHGAKLAARAANVSTRTADAWMTGRREPSASILLRMAERCDRVAARLQGVLDARLAAQESDRRRGLAGREIAESRA